MNIYFAAATVGIPEYRDNYNLILKLLRKQGFTLLKTSTILRLEGRFELSPQQLVKLENELISKADVVVLEATMTSFGIGYAFNESLRQRKPILALYLKDSHKPKTRDSIMGTESSLVSVENYLPENLEDKIKLYFANKKIGLLSKFNFIISPEVADYLDWGVYSTGKSKSEFLRDKLVTEVISRDPEYRTHLIFHHNKENKDK